MEPVVIDNLKTTCPLPLGDRGLANKHGISHQTVAETWKAFGPLKPWPQDDYKLYPACHSRAV